MRNLRLLALLAAMTSSLVATARPAAAPRLVLAEMVGNTGCIACPPSDQYLDELEAGHILELAVVNYHTWWPDPSDPYYQANPVENAGRINYYGADYDPHLRMDGVGDGGMEGSGWSSLLASRLSVAAPLTIGLAVSYNPGTRTGTMTATVTNVSGVSQSGNLRMAITESDIHWAAPNGNTVHNFTMRDMVPDHVGTPLSLAPGGMTTIPVAFSISSAWVESNCQLIVWVQKDASKEVLQTARVFFPVNRPYLVLGPWTTTPAPGGDGDAYVDPGEGGRIVVTLNNANPFGASGINVRLASSDPFITITDDSASYGSIPALGSGSNPGDPFRFAVAPGAPRGYEPEFTLTVHGPAPEDTRLFTLNVDVGSPTDYTGPVGGYFAYESSDPGYTETPVFNWVEIDSSLGGPGRWILKQDDAAIAFPIGFPFKYFGVTYDTLTVSSNGWIALGTRLVALGDPSPSPVPDADGPPAMIAGLWSDLDPSPTGGGHVFRYFDPVHHRTIVEFSGVYHQRYFGGALPETFEFILLDPAHDPTSNGDGEILVQFLDVSDPTRVVSGLEDPTEALGIEYSYFGHENPAASGIADGVAVKYTPDAPVRTDVPAGGFAAGPGTALVVSATPNPLALKTEITFRLPERVPAALRIYGVDGRRIVTLFEGVGESGPTTVRWSGHDDAGRRVPPGLYFARLETAGGTAERKIVVLR